MAYIILSDRAGEVERRELAEAIDIGRSQDCMMPVHDSLLSRRHCRIEPHGNRWVLIDLGSRNGTRIGDQTITRHVLEHGETIRFGKSRLLFQAGAFVPAPQSVRYSRSFRPVDPCDAMSSTVVGLELADMEAQSRVCGFPVPKPKPVDPRGYHEEGLGVLVAKMASGVWDTRAAHQSPADSGRSIWIKPSARSVVDPRAGLHRATRAFARNPIMRDVKQSSAASVPQSGNSTKLGLSVDRASTTRPKRWVVFTYIAVACGVFAASIVTLSWPLL